MIKDIRLSNFKAFLAPQKLSLRAKKSDRLQGNYLREGRSLLYKSAAIFSGNNVGNPSLKLFSSLRKLFSAKILLPMPSRTSMRRMRW